MIKEALKEGRMEATSVRVRFPVELHADLVAEAERQGVSLNTLIVALLAGGIGWRKEGR
jgi:predicted HicB family RNase H-like nuclease